MVSKDFIWRVTKTSEGINLTTGEALAGFDRTATVQLIGKALIGLGTTLMGSTVADEDDDEDRDDADDDD